MCALHITRASCQVSVRVVMLLSYFNRVSCMLAAPLYPTQHKAQTISTNFVRQTIHNILWTILVISTLTCDYFIYKSWTTEYDENVNNFVFAGLISIFTIILLIYLWRKDNPKTTFKNFIKYAVLILGTPLTLTLLIVYIKFFHMSFVSSTYSTNSGRTYKSDKYRNSFKATNILIDNNLSNSPDTFISVIDHAGHLDELYRLENGDSIIIDLSDLSHLTEQQRKELVTY